MTQARHARASVIAGLAAVLASQLAVNVAADTVRPGWRDPESGVRVELARRADAPLAVALGSSRTQMGLDPDSLGDLPGGLRVQVMAQAGGRAAGQLVTHERLRAAGVTPAVVLIEILPPALADPAPADASVVLSQLAARDVVTLSPHLADPAAAWRRWLGGRLLPVHTFRFNLLSAAGGGRLLPTAARTDFHRKQTRPTGWMPYFFESQSPDRRAAGLAVAHSQYGALLAGFAVRPGPAALLRAVAAEAAAGGARVAFVVPPESPAFRAWYPPGAQCELERFYADLTAATGAPVFDARVWPFAEEDFADGHHLLRHAARAYSRRLGAECLAPWLGGRETSPPGPLSEAERGSQPGR